MAYINKEDLLATINEVWERKYARCEWKTLYDLYRMCIRRINRAQVADVVQIVRCKDCKYAYIDGDRAFCRNMETPWYNDYFEVFTKTTDFCIYGERRKKDAEIH